MLAGHNASRILKIKIKRIGRGKIWNYYAVDHLMRAFELDSLESSHPIEVVVGNPDTFNDVSTVALVPFEEGIELTVKWYKETFRNNTPEEMI